jgi:2-iminoacetate synthase ThiH
MLLVQNRNANKMPRRPATITQADIARVIRAAKQAGASEVVIQIGDHPVRLSESTGQDAPLVPHRQFSL